MSTKIQADSIDPSERPLERFPNYHHGLPEPADRCVAGHRLVVLEESDTTGRVVIHAPAGDIKLTIDLTPRGPVVQLSGAPLQLDFAQSCDIRCEGKLSLSGKQGVDILSDDDICIRTKEELKMNGSRIHNGYPKWNHDRPHNVRTSRDTTRDQVSNSLPCLMLLCCMALLAGCGLFNRTSDPQQPDTIVEKLFPPKRPTWKDLEIAWIEECREILTDRISETSSSCEREHLKVSIQVLDDYKRLFTGARQFFTTESNTPKISDLLDSDPPAKNDPLSSFIFWNSPLSQKLPGLQDCSEFRTRLLDYEFIHGIKIRSELESIRLTYAGIKSLYPILAMRNLKGVILTGNKTLKDICPLAMIHDLKTLDLSETAVTDLSPLKQCQNLQELNIRKNDRLHSLIGLRDCSSLRILRLDGCRSLVDLSGLENLNNLEVVSLYGCDQVKSLLPLAGATKLKQIDVRGIRNDTDAIVNLVLAMLRETDETVRTSRDLKVILDHVELSPSQRDTIATDVVNSNVASGTNFVFQNMIITGSGIIVYL